VVSDPKEFRVVIKVSVKNNRLVREREGMGLSQRQVGEAIGFRVGFVSEFETMRRSPQSTKAGVCVGWTESAKRLAHFYGRPCEYFWPEDVVSMSGFKSSIEETLEACPQETAAITSEVQSRVASDLLRLSPVQQKVVRMRFGIAPYMREDTLAEVGKELGLCRERIWHIQAKALRLMREREEKAVVAVAMEDPYAIQIESLRIGSLETEALKERGWSTMADVIEAGPHAVREAIGGIYSELLGCTGGGLDLLGRAIRYAGHRWGT